MTNEELSAALEHCKSDAGRDSCADLALRCHKAESENVRLAALVEDRESDEALRRDLMAASKRLHIKWGDGDAQFLNAMVQEIERLRKCLEHVARGPRWGTGDSWQEYAIRVRDEARGFFDDAALLAALSPTPTPAEQRPGEAQV